MASCSPPGRGWMRGALALLMAIAAGRAEAVVHPPAPPPSMAALRVADAADRAYWQGMRNQVDQQFRDGQIDQVTRDAKTGIIDERLRDAAGQAVEAELATQTATAGAMLDQLAGTADRGSLADMASITDALATALKFARDNQLLGKPDPLGARALALAGRYYAALLARCTQDQPLAPAVLLGLERQGQLLGFGRQGTPEYQACLPRRYAASGGDGTLKISGEVLNPTLQAFTLQGAVPGGVTEHRYTPSGAAGGTSTYRATGSGVVIAGTGSYTIAPRGDTLVMTETVNACAQVPTRPCKSVTFTVTLTELPLY